MLTFIHLLGGFKKKKSIPPHSIYISAFFIHHTISCCRYHRWSFMLLSREDTIHWLICSVSSPRVVHRSLLISDFDDLLVWLFYMDLFCRFIVNSLVMSVSVWVTVSICYRKKCFITLLLNMMLRTISYPFFSYEKLLVVS